MTDEQIIAIKKAAKPQPGQWGETLAFARDLLRAAAPEVAQPAAEPVRTYHRNDEGHAAFETYAAMCACLDDAGVKRLANELAHGARAAFGPGRIALTRDDWDQIKFIPLAAPVNLTDPATQVPSEFDVRRIMIDVVPGADGMGEEVFAKNVGDVERLLTILGEKVESLEGADPATRERLAAEEQAKCAADIAFELHMTGEPTWQQVLEHVRLAYRDRCAQLSADLSRPRVVGWVNPAPHAAPQINPSPMVEVQVGVAGSAPSQEQAAPPFDVERLIAECLPGGHSLDPQQVADAIRTYCNAWPTGEQGQARPTFTGDFAVWLEEAMRLVENVADAEHCNGKTVGRLHRRFLKEHLQLAAPQDGSKARAADPVAQYDREQERRGLVEVAQGHGGRLQEVAVFLRSTKGTLEADAAVDCDRAARWIFQAARALSATLPQTPELAVSPAEGLVREVVACGASDPTRKYPGDAACKGKRVTINAPRELWDRLVASTAQQAPGAPSA